MWQSQRRSSGVGQTPKVPPERTWHATAHKIVTLAFRHLHAVIGSFLPVCHVLQCGLIKLLCTPLHSNHRDSRCRRSADNRFRRNPCLLRHRLRQHCSTRKLQCGNDPSNNKHRAGRVIPRSDAYLPHRSHQTTSFSPLRTILVSRDGVSHAVLHTQHATGHLSFAHYLRLWQQRWVLWAYHSFTVEEDTGEVALD